MPNDEIDVGTDRAKQLAGDAGRQVGKVGAKVGKKAGKKAKEVGKKAAKGILKYIAKGLKWLGSFIAGNLPAILAVFVSLVMIFIIVAVLAYQVNQASTTHMILTEEGQVIITMFEDYADEVYREGATSEPNTDSERDHYKQILQFIENNQYEYMLCGLWQIAIKTDISETYYKGNSDWLESSDKAYRMITQFYYDLADGTENPIYGYYSTLKINEFKGEMFHPYLTNEMFKACLEAFVDDDGGYISTYSEVVNQAASENTESTMSATSASSTTSMQLEDHSEIIIDMIYNNFIRGLSNRISFQNTDDSKIYLINEIYNYYRDQGQLDTGSSETDAKNVLKQDFKPKIKGAASGFLTNGGIGDVNNLVRLAKAQINNGGQKYCDALFNGVMADWCAIYAGWLLQEGGHINISDYGWSAGVGSWQRGMSEKGCYHTARGSYTPKVGDVVFFNNNAHVGIIIEINGSQITTSEGNTAGGAGNGAWCYNSKVSEYTYDLSNVYVQGFGEITYLNSGQLYDSDGNLIVGNAEGAVLRSQGGTDVNYKCLTFKQIKGRELTNSERQLLERTVFGEFGQDYNGALLIAQCMRDCLAYGLVKNVADIPSQMQYDGYYTNSSGQTNDISRKAVEYIFDWGGMAVQHRVLVMYASNYCSSAWHESLHFIYQQGYVRFFDYWD